MATGQKRLALGAIRIRFQYTQPGQRDRLVSVMSEADAP